MNYMQTLRTYCLQNTGKLFDAGYMWDKYFHMIPKKTFMKNLNRLEEEDVVRTVSKGVFIIGDVLRNCQGSGIKVFIGSADFEDRWVSAGLTRQYSVFDVHGTYTVLSVDVAGNRSAQTAART